MGNLTKQQKKKKLLIMGVTTVRRWGTVAIMVAVVGVVVVLRNHHQLDLGDKMIRWFKEMSDRLGYWAIPAYVGVHTLTLAMCLPYAVIFEAGASMLFGFVPALFCVFSAKLLGASLSFWIGRVVFRSSGSAVGWVHRNKYFHVLSRGVERDGWKFVLLARFSPIPSYIINYALAATKVGFLLDFLLPTVIGCVPMILQNTSIGSLASAAVSSSTSDTQRSQIWSYVFPLLGILSSILISLRVKKYSSDISVAVADDDHQTGEVIQENTSSNGVNSTQGLFNRKRSMGTHTSLST